MAYNFSMDIHCHPSGKPYMSGRNHQRHTPFESYRNEIQGLLLQMLESKIENLSGINLATQSNFDHLSQGKVRVVVANFTPLEKAFLFGNMDTGSFKDDSLKDLVMEHDTLWDNTLKGKVINALTGFEVDDVEFIKRDMVNYFTQGLVPEYEYLIKFNNFQIPGKNYSIRLVKNYEELEATLAGDDTTICVVLAIEGAHCLDNVVPDKVSLFSNQGKSHKTDPTDLTPLIVYENNINQMKQWAYVPLYVTLNHHFWNKLGGHAQSLTKMLGTLVSQQEGLNEGLKELGKEVCKRLLNKTNGPRIYIDIKHMSPLCRKNFYAFIEMEYWNKQDIFPIICSHTGIVSKNKTLDQLIALHDDSELNDPSNYLHECSINLCEEDIQLIAKTKGLIGIQLDEKRIMGKEIINVIKNNPTAGSLDLRKQYIKILAANLFEVVKAVGDSSGWYLLSIGSDYDGLINHLDFYPDSSYMQTLKNDLLIFLENPEEIFQEGFNYRLTIEAIKELMFELSAQEITDQVFAGNAMEFLRNNFVR